jgi:recombination protein RecT
LQIAASNDMLKNADPHSIYNAAATAATLDLPLNNALGFAYIVPFNQKQKDGSYKVVAQFMIGAKGFKQLALRTGQFLTIHTTDVREGEIKNNNRMTGEIEFDWVQNEEERLKKKIVGYVSYFKLLNGYQQTYYMSVEKLTAHGSKYSKTFNNDFGLWKTDFDGMCQKTVMKLNLSKNAPLSIEMKKAIVVDQSVINNSETEDISYVDAEDKKELKQNSNALLETEEEKIEVKTETNALHTDAVSSDVGKVNTEVQDKGKGKKKDNELPLS